MAIQEVLTLSHAAYVLIFSCLALGAPPSSNRRNETIACVKTRQIFNQLDRPVGLAAPMHPLTGSDLNICPNTELSCCRQDMENVYMEAVKTNLASTLQSSLGSLYPSLNAGCNIIEEQLKAALAESERATVQILSDTHHLAVPHSQIRDFFETAVSLLSESEDPDLAQRTKALFAELYPSVLMSSNNGASTNGGDITSSETRELMAEYRDCVHNVYPEIEPFGDLPHALQTSLTRTLLGTKTLLSSLRTASSVLTRAERIPQPEGCAQGLVRVTYCSHCAGYASSRPCPRACLNAAEACVVRLQRLETTWKAFDLALQRLALALAGHYSDVEQELQSIDTRISQAVVFALDNAPDQEKKLERLCGPIRYNPVPQAQNTTSPPSVSPKPTLPHSSIKARIQDLVTEAQNFRFSRLPELMCGESEDLQGGRCWTGSELRPTRNVDYVGDDPHSPDHLTPGDDYPEIQALADELDSATKEMISHATAFPPHTSKDPHQDDHDDEYEFYDEQPDEADEHSGYYDGSGNGGNYDDPYDEGHPPDDEDSDMYGEGSGSGDDSITDDTLDPSTEPDFGLSSESPSDTQDSDKSPGGAGLATASSALIALAVLVAFQLLSC